MGNVWRKVIASLEVIGGICGLIVLWLQLREKSLSTGLIVLAAIIAGIYVLALVAGVLLWRGVRAGHRLSVLVQIAQLPKLATTKIIYMMSFGFDFAVIAAQSPGPSGYGIVFDAKFGAFHQLFVDNPNVNLACGLSIVSVVFLLALQKKSVAVDSEQPSTLPNPPDVSH